MRRMVSGAAVVTMLLLGSAPALSQTLEEVERQVEAAERKQREQAAAAKREADARAAAEEEAKARREAQARLAAPAAPKGPDRQETLEWLRGYFATTSEAFEAYDGSTKTLSTIERIDASTSNRYAYDICSARRISPTPSVKWRWVETTAYGYLRINWNGAKGCKGPAESCAIFSGGWGFDFPQPTTFIATEPNPTGGVKIAVGAPEAARERLLSNSAHPVHRFRRAFERLIELECGGSVDSPFE